MHYILFLPFSDSTSHAASYQVLSPPLLMLCIFHRIGRNGKPTLPTFQPSGCITQEAEICSSSTFILTTSKDGTTSTIKSSATSTCDTIRGCIALGGHYDTSSTRGSKCGSKVARRTALPDAVFSAMPLVNTFASPTPSSSSFSSSYSSAAPSTTLSPSYLPTPVLGNGYNNITRPGTRLLSQMAGEPKKAPPLDGRDHVMIWPMYPDKPRSVDAIRQYLRDEARNPNMPNRPSYGDFKEVKATGAGDDGGDWTALFFVHNMQRCHMEQLEEDLEDLIEDIYGIYERNKGSNYFHDGRTILNRDSGVDAHDSPAIARMQRREVLLHGPQKYWELSQINVGPGMAWDDSWKQDPPSPPGHEMYYQADESFGLGQTIFVLEDDVEMSNPEFRDIFHFGSESISRERIRFLPEFDWGDQIHEGGSYLEHGTQVMSKLTGWELGLAKRAKIIVVKEYSNLPADPYNMIWERHLENWLRVYDEVRRIYTIDPSQRGKIIICTAFGFLEQIHDDVIRRAMVKRWCKYPLFPSLF
jgi:hypothetical protein